MEGFAAIVLAGGAGTRLGGAGKPMLPVHGRPMLERVLDAVAEADVTVVVGPPELALPGGLVRVSEHPPGGGPVAATAAGLAALAETGLAEAGAEPGRPGGAPVVGLFAADLPFLDAAAVEALRAALRHSTVDGVVYVDSTGRRQNLCGAWRPAPLRAALDRLGPPAGASMRALLAGLRIGELTTTAQPPPWYDCDQPDDLIRAEEWTR